MTYLPQDIPGPQPNDEDGPFWANCNQRRLTFQCCCDCNTVIHPPLPICPACQSRDRTWIEAPSTARVFTFTWARTAAHESVRPVLPYNIAVVEFPDLPGVRLVTNVIDAAPESLAIGEIVALVWEDGPGGQRLPRFSKARASHP
jgi:uncharacterized protein